MGLAGLALGAAGCAGPPETKVEPVLPKPQLIFQSGFEGSCRVAAVPRPAGSTSYETDDISGVDPTCARPNDWEADLDRNPDAGRFYLEYTGGDSLLRKARIVPDPVNPANRALSFRINESYQCDGEVKGRVQASLYGIGSGYREFYQSVRMFVPADMNLLRTYPKSIGWLTIAEFWNNEWWVPTERYGFRVTLGMGKPTSQESDLVFILNAEDQGQREVWKASPSAVKVPIGQWFTLDYYYKEGNAQTGRFYVAITPAGQPRQVVFDVRNFTHNTTDPAPNGVTGFNPMKLYTSRDVIDYMRGRGKPVQVYWDDFKLWKNKRPE